MDNINYYKDTLYSKLIGYDDVTIDDEDELVELKEFNNGVIIGTIYKLDVEFVVYSSGLYITPWYKTKNPITRQARNGLELYRRNYRI